MATEAQVAHNRQIAQRGGVARAAKLSPIRRSEIARAGYRAVCAKYGSEHKYRRKVQDRIAEWRRLHPSCHETTIAQILDSLRVAYEREAMLFKTTKATVDFFLTEFNTVIEVNGWGHSLDEQHRKDVRKYAALRRKKHDVLVIDHKEIGVAAHTIAEHLATRFVLSAIKEF